MLSRLLSVASSGGRSQTRSTLAGLLAARQFRTSAAALGGHGGHHDEPIPPHIPRPQIGERSWFGEARPPRITKDGPYRPTAADIKQWVVAFAGLGLTFLAVQKYTLKDDGHGDAGHGKKGGHGHDLGSEDKKGGSHHGEQKSGEEKKEVVHAEKENEEEEEKPQEKHEEPLRPVVEKKLVVVPVHVEKAATEEPAAPVEKLEPGQLPSHVPYLLIGGGAASYFAALVIRARDPNAQVLIVSDEMHLPYNRPPLSKELWWYSTERTGEHLEYKSPTGRTRDVFHEAEGFYVPPHALPATAHGGVGLVRGRKVVKIDASTGIATLDNGATIEFGKCLIATGGTPRCLPELQAAPEGVKRRVLYYRGIDDYRRLNEEAATAKSITVIGGGLLGSELAYSLKRRYEGQEVNQVLPELGQLAAVLPEYLSDHARKEMEKVGINVHAQSRVGAASEGQDGRVKLSIVRSTLGAEGKAKEVETDLVVVAIGIEPNEELARASGFETDPVNGGILADSEMRVRGSVYTAGDAASFYDAKLGRRRLGHWENAQVSGRLAGKNMTGGKEAFWYQPSFFTKIAPMMLLNAVGDTRAEHETKSFFAATESGQKYERGVVFYVKDDKIVGVLLVNVTGNSIDVARRLIDDAVIFDKFDDFRDLARLFPLYEIPEEKKPEPATTEGEEKKE